MKGRRRRRVLSAAYSLNDPFFRRRVKARIRQVMEGIEPIPRLIFILRYAEGLSIRKIALLVKMTSREVREELMDAMSDAYMAKGEALGWFHDPPAALGAFIETNSLDDH